MHEPTLPLNKADREVIMLALSEWILFTHAIAFDADEKGYTRQEITRMRNNIVKVKKLLARLRGQLPAGTPVVVNTINGGLVPIGRVPA